MTLYDLLRRWKALPSEPHPGDGLSETHEDFLAHENWNALYTDLVWDTDNALAAEARENREYAALKERVSDLEDRLDDVCERCQENCHHQKPGQS